MASKSSMRDKSMASFLKDRGVQRNSGACPWGCGHLVTNGGQALMIHLNVCKGKTRKVSR